MTDRFVIHLIVLLLVAEQGFAQVATLCRSRERYLPCGGCQRTCAAPAPACSALCRPGCHCAPGEVRGADGACMPLADCPYVAKLLPPSTSVCPPDEEYRLCEPCAPTCASPNPVCPAQCARGCFCKEGLLRNAGGKCVKPEYCGAAPPPPALNCTALEEYRQCGGCEARCGAEPACAAGCAGACVCKEGLARTDGGLCVLLKRCPRANPQPTMNFAYDSSVEDCGSSEVYLSCGWCEPTCSRPRASCPGQCTRGCLCRPPLVRHKSGNCVQLQDCEPKQCKQNEDYTCRFGCEPSCGDHTCVFRLSRCALGCHCRPGFLRSRAGECVSEDQC